MIILFFVWIQLCWQTIVAIVNPQINQFTRLLWKNRSTVGTVLHTKMIWKSKKLINKLN